ncbi:MAG TPA: alkaline phosphatase family protein, partial [Candidatus Limnocylindrales bacterium]
MQIHYHRAPEARLSGLPAGRRLGSRVLGLAIGAALLGGPIAQAAPAASPAPSSSTPATSPAPSGSTPSASPSLGSSTASTSPTPGSSTPSTPIEHVVVLMQENHTFDNYFGTFPGAEGIPSGTCVPRDPIGASAGCVAPFHLDSHRTTDLNHGLDVATRAINDGKMNGF